MRGTNYYSLLFISHYKYIKNHHYLHLKSNMTTNIYFLRHYVIIMCLQIIKLHVFCHVIGIGRVKSFMTKWMKQRNVVVITTFQKLLIFKRIVRRPRNSTNVSSATKRSRRRLTLRTTCGFTPAQSRTSVPCVVRHSRSRIH